jgi:solute carrier family 9 (sodium/hydrogen exchanger), member 6/7
MSRRTQLTTKYLFQVLAQLSENFIFIYLGLTLFTETDLVFKPLFILVTVVGICVARYLSVFPLSKAINWFIRWRARKTGKEAADELPYPYQAMLFWAGLRGAVGVALAAGLVGEQGPALRATVLVVVVLTVIIFGGTTARMLEILGIRTGVVEEIDSDDEFDIETGDGGTYYKRTGRGLGHNPKRSVPNIDLDHIESRTNGHARRPGQSRGYSSSNRHSPPGASLPGVSARKNGSISQREQEVEQNLLSAGTSTPSDDDEEVFVDEDLPPAARRSPPRRKPSPLPGGGDISDGLRRAGTPDVGGGGTGEGSQNYAGMTGSVRQLLSRTAEDHAAWFRHLDEDYIKPKLLLDQGQGKGGGGA